MLEVLSLQTGVIFLLLLIGYACRKFRVYDFVVQKGLANLVLTVALPCKLVSSATLAIEDVGLDRIKVFCIICFIYFAAGIVVFTSLAKYVPLDPIRRKQFGILAVFPASAFMGMPIASALYGDKGVFFMGMFSIFYSMFQYTYGIGIYTGIRKENIVRLALNPLLISSCLMILLFSLQLRLPAVIQSTLATVGQTSTPLSMFVVGGIVSEQPLRRVFLEKTCYLISFSRLILIPLVALTLFRLLNVESFLAILLTIVFALPSSSTSAVLADKYAGNSTYSSIAVAQSMVFFLITIPCIIYILGRFWVF